MMLKLTLLHLRWFGLFAFVGLLAILFGHMQEGNLSVLSNPTFYAGLGPMLTVCAILAVLVPWGMFMVDPRRVVKGNSLENFLSYWRATPSAGDK